ncbi:MAG: ATP-binding cassette domain-containing protein [Candidatus Manganitrophaceae bacterium]|nr:MAG: ATP-binding cassette domain-containing protein [Candidatus Manganitrophaceae bacterium]
MKCDEAVDRDLIKRIETNYLEISRVSKTFEGANGIYPAVQGIDLKIRKGEFVTLIGHSGCGKSTLLSMVAGLVAPSEGGIVLEGKEIDGPGPDRGVVFQSHALLPWLTCRENIALAVEAVFPQMSRKEQKDRVSHFLDMVGLTEAAQKRPAELSGGMRQRVGIARALAIRPKVLLLDEPFGALDALTRGHLQDELLRIWEKFGTTVLMVTHDVDEALLLSDRVVMMTRGPAATIGRIVPIPFRRPRSRMELVRQTGYQHWKGEILEFLYGEGDAKRRPGGGDLQKTGAPEEGPAFVSTTDNR